MERSKRTALAAMIACALVLLCAACIAGCAGEGRNGAASGGQTLLEQEEASSESTAAEASGSTADAEGADGQDAAESMAGAASTPEDETTQGERMNATAIQLEVNGQTMQATLEDNASAQAFADLLAQGPVTVSMDDYANMEKVGPLPQSLPRSDAQISAGPGDVILYQGDQITVYYGTNSWSFTRLAHVEGATADQMRAFLGTGAADVTFSLA